MNLQTLRTDRVLFTKLLVQLVQYGNSLPGIEIALDEVMVHSPRIVKLGQNKVRAEDAVHRTGSFHYLGMAADILIYRDGKYVSDGSDEIYQQLNAFARQLDPTFGLGIKFHDANHVSLGEGS